MQRYIDGSNFTSLPEQNKKTRLGIAETRKKNKKEKFAYENGCFNPHTDVIGLMAKYNSIYENSRDVDVAIRTIKKSRS